MTFFTKYKLLFASLVAFLLSFAFVSCNVFYFGADDDDDEPTSYSVTISDSIANGTVTASSTSATAGTEITLTATANTGYDFSAWNVTDASGNAVTVTDNKFTMPASNVTVSATFTATTTTYTVTIASTIANGTVTASATSATAGTEITLTATASTGYDFSAWNVTDASGNAVTVTNNKFSMPASNVTVSATFTATEATSYTVTFNSNGGSNVTSQTVTSGSTATEPTVPTKESTATTRYTFAGWYNGDTKFDFSTAITANITLTAHWTETAIKPTVNSITVVFNNNASDLELEKTVTETGIVYTVPADYDVEHVSVDSGDPDDAQGFTLSDDSRTLTITEADLVEGHWYDVYFDATKDGRTYSVRFQITKE